MLRTIRSFGLLAVLLLALVVPAGAAYASTASHASGHTASAPIRNSASGCNGSVCITVNGSGLHVNYVESSAKYPKTFTTYAQFYLNGRAWLDSFKISGKAGDTYSTGNITIDENFANGTQICVSWPGISGRPCETIES